MLKKLDIVDEYGVASTWAFSTMRLEPKVLDRSQASKPTAMRENKVF
jgi:hypothetical protein